MDETAVMQGGKGGGMCIFETIKLFAEIITSLATAFVVITNLFKFCNPTIKKFFNSTIPLFFKGYTNPNGKKICFFKGLKLQREENRMINNAISPGFETEEVLVLDKKALLDIISNSDAFNTIHLHKK
jgi:hypothetical protein